MKKYKIFVSGVQKELQEERKTVQEIIKANIFLRQYFEVFLFENHPAQGKSACKVYIDEVLKCDIYLGIFGYKYGEQCIEGMSATEKEFRTAKQTGKEILIYIKGNEDRKRDRLLQKLINEIRDVDRGYKYKRYKDIAELKNSIFDSLYTFLQDRGRVNKEAFDKSLCDETTWEDIDESKVEWFLRTARAKRKYALNERAPLKEALLHLNLLRNGKLTNAAILLFGKNPHRFFLQAEVKCVHLLGTEVYKPFPSYKIYNGNLFEQVDKSVAFVLDIIKQSVIQQEHTAQFKRLFEIPVFAIQEAIVNAVAHRNYNVTSGVQVMVFTDRVEVWNSGSLPPELTVEDLKKPHTSFPANPLLANALYLADYIQKTGSGTLEMVKQCRAQGAPEPEFVCIRNLEFRTILARDIFTESALNKLGLNERQLKAVKYVKEKGKITNKEYRELTEISRQMATIDLAEIVKKGLFVRLGKKGRGIAYQLTKLTNK